MSLYAKNAIERVLVIFHEDCPNQSWGQFEMVNEKRAWNVRLMRMIMDRKCAYNTVDGAPEMMMLLKIEY